MEKQNIVVNIAKIDKDTETKRCKNDLIHEFAYQGTYTITLTETDSNKVVYSEELHSNGEGNTIAEVKIKNAVKGKKYNMEIASKDRTHINNYTYRMMQ